MKTKMKRQGSTELPRFAVGALAIAGASAANAATVQISFNNSFISSTLGNQLDTDFGGDLVADILGTLLGPLDGVYLRMMPNGSLGQADEFNGLGLVILGGLGVHWGVGGADVVLRGLVSFTLVDQLVRAGAPTLGWLDVTATGRAAGELGRMEVHRFIFDDAGSTAPTGLTTASTGIPEWQVSAVPEPGSNLALLALGAGGLTLRRRLKRAA
jgi:hypothetical protein